jgi:protoporphyrinogen/coproporphyrinogen III oxidase
MMYDLVVVGAGLAGLSAAWTARDADVLVLEESDRVGGRIRSERRGPYWLNWGAHVFGGRGSGTSELLASLDVRSATVKGNLSAIAMNDRLLTTGRVETYPLRIPMSWPSRLASFRAGAKVRIAVTRYGRVGAPRAGEDYLARQQRIYDFMGDRSFRDFVGPLPGDADALFRPTVTRSAGEPEQISAGAGIGYFHLVWNRGEGLSQNILGGPSELTEAIAAALEPKLMLRSAVKAVVLGERHVDITFNRPDGREETVRAAHVVMATPAPVTRAVVCNLPDDLASALDKIVYGPYVSAAFLTDETGPAPWDSCYAVATPKRSFNVVFNMSNVIRGVESTRAAGSSIMVFSPATLAQTLLDHDDADIIAIYMADLKNIFPELPGVVTESHVQRWPLGLAYCFPGRARLQPALIRPRRRLALAGDYLGTWYTETAVQTGRTAAERFLVRPT